MKKILFLFISSVILSSALAAQDAEAILKKKGIVLIPPSSPVANYVNAVRTGNLLYLAGKGPLKADNTYITGKVGKDLTIEQGYEAARLTAISHLGVLKTELGS